MGVTIKCRILESRDTIALLERLPIAIRGTIASKARKAAGRLVQRRAKELCPRGDTTGTTDLLSEATKAKRGDAKPLADTISVVDREAKFLTVIGPAYPAGAHGHLVEAGHEEVLWGVKTGRRVPPHPFMRPAVDETIDQQQQVMSDVIQQAVEAEIGGG